MSKKFELAGDIAGALAVGERSMNQAALDLLAVGTAVFTARNSGHFHPLEAQREVERIGMATQSLITAIGEIARAHDSFHKKVRELKMDGDGTGNLCPWPTAQHVESNVVEIGVAA